MITHTIRCLHVIVRHHTAEKMPYQRDVTSTPQTALIRSTHLGIDLMVALMLRYYDYVTVWICTEFFSQLHLLFPLPSSGRNLSNDDCLEVKRKDYHHCFVPWCV